MDGILKNGMTDMIAVLYWQVGMLEISLWNSAAF